MTATSPTREPAADAADRSLPALASLVEEIADLKRVRAAHLPDGDSWATDRFRQAWRQLLSCRSLDDVEELAVQEASRATAAARLGAITPQQLRKAGLKPSRIQAVFADAIREQADALDEPLLLRLVDAVEGWVEYELAGLSRVTLSLTTDTRPSEPSFVGDLCRQPRAGATCPGKARYLLDPPELHSDHCYVVAVAATLAAAGEGTSPSRPFLFGLAHHLHNATLADGGFAGEVLLGDAIDDVIDALFERAFDQLLSAPMGWLIDEVRTLRQETAAADTPDARAFHTADVLDRVAEMRHFERAATFVARTALEDLDLVHAGPIQKFGQRLLRDAGWWDAPTGD